MTMSRREFVTKAAFSTAALVSMMADIGILGSTDPVALDQACVDLVYAAENSSSLIQRIESRNGQHTLDYAEAIGLGSRQYDLIEI